MVCFHEIGEVVSPWSVTPGHFARFVEWLATGAINVLTMMQVAEHYAHGMSPVGDARSGHALALTFDDARTGVWQHARAVLRDHGFCATIYAVHSWSRGATLPHEEAYAPVLGLDALGRLRADGYEIGYHSRRHACYRQLAIEEVIEEVTVDRELFERELGVPLAHFSYPFGHHDERVHKAVLAHGHFASVVTASRDLRCDPLRHPRISIKPWHTEADFARLFVADSWRSRRPLRCTH